MSQFLSSIKFKFSQVTLCHYAFPEIFHGVHIHHGILSGICLMRIFTTIFLVPVQMTSFFAVSRMHFCSSGHSVMSYDERSESARVTGCIRRIFYEHSDRGYFLYAWVVTFFSGFLCIRSGQGFLHIAILTISLYIHNYSNYLWNQNIFNINVCKSKIFVWISVWGINCK